jgi:hypothetical protein
MANDVDDLTLVRGTLDQPAAKPGVLQQRFENAAGH